MDNTIINPEDEKALSLLGNLKAHSNVIFNGNASPVQATAVALQAVRGMDEDTLKKFISSLSPYQSVDNKRKAANRQIKALKNQISDLENGLSFVLRFILGPEATAENIRTLSDYFMRESERAQVQAAELMTAAFAQNLGAAGLRRTAGAPSFNGQERLLALAQEQMRAVLEQAEEDDTVEDED